MPIIDFGAGSNIMCMFLGQAYKFAVRVTDILVQSRMAK